MPVAAIAAGAQTVGSFIQSDNSKNAAKANQAQESSIDNQLMSVYNSMMKNVNQVDAAVNPAQSLGAAKGFYANEMSTGLAPAVINQANASFQQNNAQNLSTLKNSLGAATPNIAGTIKDFENSQITGNVGLQQGLAAQNQGARNTGAAGLTGIGENVLDQSDQARESVAAGLGALGSQYQQAGEFNASGQTNPFSGITSFLASLGLGGGTPGGGTTTPGVASGSYQTGQYSGQPWSYNSSTPPPGQGGLGAGSGSGYGNFG